MSGKMVREPKVGPGHDLKTTCGRLLRRLVEKRPTRALAALTVREWYVGRVEKRSQVIENTLEPGLFFMKLHRPKGVRDMAESP